LISGDHLCRPLSIKDVFHAVIVMRFVPAMFLLGQIKRESPLFFTQWNVGTAELAAWSAP